MSSNPRPHALPSRRAYQLCLPHPTNNSDYLSPAQWPCKLNGHWQSVTHSSHNCVYRRFDALLKTYEQLSEMVLFTFRTDIRCRAIHYLNLSIRRVSYHPFLHFPPLLNFHRLSLQGNYQLEHEPIEPDPHIVELNIEIGKCDDAVVASLPERERR